MSTPSLEQVQAKLKPLIGDGETLSNSAFAQTMPKRKMLLLFPMVVLLMSFVGVFAARLLNAFGLIEPGPMMPAVGMLLGFPFVMGPYLYYLSKGTSKCAVGLTSRRLLIVDLSDGESRMPTKQFSTAAAASFKSSVGFVFGAGFATQLTVPTPDGEVRLVFPSAFRGNKDQAMAITQSLTRN